MAKEKLLLPMILLSTACFGLEPDIENLVSNQDKIVADHDSQAKDFVLQAELNSHERQHAVQEIINNSQKNVGCDVTLCKGMFPEINSNKDQANINMEEQKLYIFVSLSMPPASLLALLKDSSKFGGTLVLRGLKENSYKKTAHFLQQIIKQAEMGLIIDPELFKKYEIQAVPTVVVAGTKTFDKITGNISLQYALEQIVKSGDLSTVASHLLQKKI